MLDQRSRPSFSILHRFLQLPLVPWTEKTSELCPFPSTSPGQPRRMPVALDKRAVAGSRNHVQLHSCTFLVEDKPRKIIRLYAFGYMLQAMDKHSGGLWFLVLKTDLELLGNSLSDPKLLGLPTRDDNSQIGIQYDYFITCLLRSEDCQGSQLDNSCFEVQGLLVGRRCLSTNHLLKNFIL